MRCLLIALSVALACGTQDIFVPWKGENLDIQKVTGRWFSVAMVASDLTLLDSESAPLRLSIQALKPTAQDGLEITMLRREGGRCVERKMLAEKTEVPDSFQISSMEEGAAVPIPDLEDGKVHLLDTDYENFVFLCMETASTSASASASAEQSVACQYLARTPKADETIMEHFNNAMRLLSVRMSIILTPAQAEERCRV